MEHSGESTMHCGLIFGRPSLLGRHGRPKVVSIKIFTISRDRFGRPDIIFSIQATGGR